MTKKKSAKRAFISSFMSFIMCFAMLAGTTFAWYTDSVTSSGNRILAGTLDVDLLMYKHNDNTNADEYMSIAGGVGDIFREADVATNSTATLWEPGKTQVVYLAVKNNGNLALRYNIMLDIRDVNVNDTTNLADALDFAVVPGAKNTNTYESWTAVKNAVPEAAQAANIGNIGAAMRGDAAVTPSLGRITAAQYGKLDPVGYTEDEDGVDYFALAVHMKEEAGNEYMGTSIIIDVTVIATQATVEYDSFNNQYDANATTPVATTKVETEIVNNVKIVTESVTVYSTYTANDTPATVMTVPVGAAVTDNNLDLIVYKTETPANFTVTADQNTTTYEVDVEGLDKDNNTALFTITLPVEKNKSNFILYHNGVAMNKKSSAEAVTADQDYYYDAAAGTVEFKTSTFSPFTSTYDKELWKDYAAESIATVDTVNKTMDITSAEELAYFANNVAQYQNYTVNIKNDIDLGEKLWTPISSFNGTIEGENHIISNMTIVANNAYGNGFFNKFGYSGLAVMNNLTFDGATVQRYSNNALSGNVYGVIAGYAAYYGSAEFNNVTVKDSTVYGFGKVAAFVGMAEMQGGHIYFKDCTVDNVTINSGYNAGGFVGLIHNNIEGVKNTATFDNCSVDVEFNSVGIGDIVELEGLEGKYSLYNGQWYYADTAVYFNEYNVPSARDDIDAIVHNTPYNMIP